MVGLDGWEQDVPTLNASKSHSWQNAMDD